MYKIKAVIVVLLLVSNILNAQVNINSPYSRYGVGDIFSGSFSQTNGMGGASIAVSSNNNINFFNPASYNDVDSLSFIFEVGYSNKFKSFKVNDNSDYNNYSNLEYISAKFPITKWWAASFGLLPYSSIGYNLKSESSNVEFNEIDYFFNGNGGIDQLYFGSSFKIINNLYLGANFTYLFGGLNQENSIIFPNDNYSANTFINKQIYVSGINFNYGLQYKLNLKEEKYLKFGAIYTNKKSLSASRTYLSTSSVTSGGVVANDTIENIIDEKGKVGLPQSIGLGVSYNINKKLIIAADYYKQNWSDVLVFGNNDSLVNSDKISLGFEYTPVWNDALNYYKRIKYRAGLKYQNTYININDKQINDIGISFGVGLPLRKTKTSINLAFEFGKRGTTTNNLLQENYINFSLNLTLGDYWFMKRKFK